MSNILLNRSFESGNIDNWTKGGTTSSVVKSSSFAYEGTYSCKFDNPTTSYSGRSIESDQIAATPGLVYTPSVWIYIEDTGSGLPSSSSTTHVRMRLKFYDASHSFLSYGVWDYLNPSFGYVDITTWDSWLYKEFSFTSPASTAFVSLLFESREENNPSPPPVGQPNNDVYLDYATIDRDPLIYGYREDDQRIVSAIGDHYDEDDQRIWGYILDPMPSDDDYRIYGLIADHISRRSFLISGEIIRKAEWLEEPDDEFIVEENRKCNFPQKRVLFFHDSLPDNTVAGPDGALKYIDLTDRTVQIGSISRTIPSSPSDNSSMVVSDLKLTVDNSDYYFSDRNEDSPFKTILDDGENYIGWDDGGRVEIWCGFNYDTNITKLIRKAKMVIVNIETLSDTGKATISLRDYVSNMLDQLVGVPTALEALERPLEYPRLTFYWNGSAALDQRFIEFETEYTNLLGLGWVKVYIPAGKHGKHTRAILMQEAMNQPLAGGGIFFGVAALLGMGLTVSSDDTYSFTFDEESQRYTASCSGPKWIRLRMNIGAGATDRWGWGGGTSHGNGTDETSLESVDNSLISANTVNFTGLLETLIEDDGGWASADVSIESLSIDFWNVRWDNTSLLTCIADVVQCGSGAMWMDDDGKIYFRQFTNMDADVTKEMTGSENYRRATYIGQDADKKVRKVTVQGKFDGLVGEVDSGSLLGTEYDIKSPVLDGGTPLLAQTMAQNYYNRYNVSPAVLKLQAEYLPSIQVADKISLIEASSPIPILGQVTKINLDPSGFKSVINIIPFTLAHTWQGKDDWDDFNTEDATLRLYVPHDETDLQMKLQEYSTGYRDYIFEYDPSDPTSKATWLNFSYVANLDHKRFFIDHCDYTWVGRYTAVNTEMNDMTPHAGYATGPLGTWNFDAANYMVVINSLADNCNTFLIVDGLMNEAAPLAGHYLDYRILTQIKAVDILDVDIVNWGDTWTVQSKLHYLGNLIRYHNILNYNYSFSRAAGGWSTPRTAASIGGVRNYINAYTSGDLADDGVIPFDTWIEAVTGTSGGRISYQIDGISSLIDPFSDIFSPWTGPTQAGVGCARSKSNVRRLELSSDSAPDAPAPVFEYWTKALAGDPWVAMIPSTDFPTGVSSKFILVRVNMSRPSKYDTVPILKSMTVSHTPS